MGFVGLIVARVMQRISWANDANIVVFLFSVIKKRIRIMVKAVCKEQNNINNHVI